MNINKVFWVPIDLKLKKKGFLFYKFLYKFKTIF